MDNIGILILIKVEGNDLIAATGHYDILAVSHQPTNELVSPDSSRF
jgi:hypothetical protein